MWSVYAGGAAFFAALTAIFAKLGVGNVDSNLATAIRTSFILVLTWGIVPGTGAARGLRSLDGHTLFFSAAFGPGNGAFLAVLFQGHAVGRRSRVAPVDKLASPGWVVLAMVFLHEPVSLKVIAGGLLITAGPVVSVLSPPPPPVESGAGNGSSVQGTCQKPLFCIHLMRSPRPHCGCVFQSNFSGNCSADAKAAAATKTDPTGGP